MLVATALLIIGLVLLVYGADRLVLAQLFYVVLWAYPR